MCEAEFSSRDVIAGTPCVGQCLRETGTAYEYSKYVWYSSVESPVLPIIYSTICE